MTRRRSMRPVKIVVTLAVCLLAWITALGQAPRPDRSAPPIPGPPPPLKPPLIQEHRLSNGLRVWMVEMHEVPVAQTTLLVRAGASADPKGQFGLAHLTAAMLDEGAGDRSGLQIADEIESLGASLEAFSSFDAAGVSVWVPVARWTEAMGVLADVALRPTFPAVELERVRKDLLTSILQSRDDAAIVASQAFARLVYGPAHRYGTPVLGTPAAVARLSSNELRSFYNAHYRPDEACLILVGALEPKVILAVLEKEFGKWSSPGFPPVRPTVGDVKPASRRRVVIVNMPGAEQSEVRIGGSSAARSTPDYFPIVVMNTVLGDSFTSRLNMNLREEHGYAYGAFSVFSMRRNGGPFLAGAGVETSKTADAISEFFREFNGMLKPIPSGELDRAKSNVALSLPSTFETVDDVSERLLEILTFDLPLDYYGSYGTRINAVTQADVGRIATRYLNSDRFLVVIAGDRAAIESGVRGLKLGRVETMTVDQALDPVLPVLPGKADPVAP